MYTLYVFTNSQYLDHLCPMLDQFTPGDTAQAYLHTNITCIWMQIPDITNYIYVNLMKSKPKGSIFVMIKLLRSILYTVLKETHSDYLSIMSAKWICQCILTGLQRTPFKKVHLHTLHCIVFVHRLNCITCTMQLFEKDYVCGGSRIVDINH